MIRPYEEYENHRPIEINLKGPEGNAFALLAKAKDFSK